MSTSTRITFTRTQGRSVSHVLKFFIKITGHIATLIPFSLHQILVIFIIRRNRTNNPTGSSQTGDHRRRRSRPIIFRMPAEFIMRNLWSRLRRRRRDPTSRRRRICASQGHYWFRISERHEENDETTGIISVGFRFGFIQVLFYVESSCSVCFICGTVRPIVRPRSSRREQE